MTTRTLVVGAVCLFLAACSGAPDMAAVQAEKSRSVKRYDIIQSVAANGEVILAGTQDGAVLSSADQGKTWLRNDLGPVSLLGLTVCPDKTFVGIDFYHKVWTSDAKGNGWKAVPLDKPRTPLTVSCDTRGRWWVAGSGAKIAVSADKGANWTVSDLKEDAQFTTLQMVDDKHGIAMGEFGMVVTTQDSGTTWQKTATIPNEFYPYAALFINASEGWASGIAGQVLHTRDGGKTWNKDVWAKDGNGKDAAAALYQLFLHDGKPTGVGAGGLVARYEGGQWRPVAYPDAVPVFLGGGASLTEAGVKANGAKLLAMGGPGGLVRVVDTHKN